MKEMKEMKDPTGKGHRAKNPDVLINGIS